MRLAIGWDGKVWRTIEGERVKWGWTLRFYNKEVANGVASTEEEAYRAVAMAAGAEQVTRARDKAPKKVAMLNLLGWLKRRPHLVASVLSAYLNLNLRSDKDVRRVALEKEQYWWDQNVDPNKKPISTHGNTLPSVEVIKRLTDAIKGAELIRETKPGIWDVRKLRRFAIRWFGRLIVADATATPEMITNERIARILAEQQGIEYDSLPPDVEEDEVPTHAQDRKQSQSQGPKKHARAR